MTRPQLSLVWDDRFRAYDFGPDHPFSERSRALAVRLLAELAPATEPGPVTWVDGIAPAPPELLQTFHQRGYLDFVAAAAEAPELTLLDAGDTPAFPGCYEAAARLVAGAVKGLDLAVEHGWPSFHPAGGLHHAHPDRASGFCIFNDVAVAVSRAVHEHRRVAYVDIDAHHGDGVMYGFFESGQVLDIDFHQDGRTLFPGTGFANETGRGDGSGLKVNVPLPPGAGDEAFLPIFRRIVPPLLRSFKPEVIILQHGVDGHVGDALAQLQYTPAAYAEVDRTILELSKELAHGRLLVTGGGGYAAESVSRVLARAGVVLAGLPEPADRAPVPPSWRDEFREVTREVAPETWGEYLEPIPSRWRPHDEADLVAMLETELGQRFPKAD